MFVAEAVSLAHVVRLALLAEALDPARYEIWFASARFPALVFAGTRFIRRRIVSQSPERTLARAARAQRPWDEAVLAANVREEVQLLEEVRPELVVGDFRLSLAISAPLTGTPYASLINAYWSPYAVRRSFPIPEHPLVKLLGVQRVAPRFAFALPYVFRHFARPINRLRKRHGLPALGGLLETLTFGDYTLYPDIPELAPTRDLPASHRYLGTLSWSPRVGLPGFWEQMDHSRPLVYVTLGSSGDLRALAPVLEAARTLPITMLVASARRSAPREVPPNVWITDFVPGDLVARRAALVICNGGSTTGYQALEQGTPVLGVPSHFDQYLASETIAGAGAGLYVRSGDASGSVIAAAVTRLLSEDSFRNAARRLQASLQLWAAQHRFREFVDARTAHSRHTCDTACRQ